MSDAMTRLAERLRAAGLVAGQSKQGAGFGDGYERYSDGALEVTLQSDRGQEVVYLRATGEGESFDADIWRAVLDGEPAPAGALRPAADQCAFVERQLDGLRRLAAHPDATGELAPKLRRAHRDRFLRSDLGRRSGQD
ncbi:MAG TPA: hypothetical protein VF062_12365 [Candidatus Limnocylindrales bacterium]